MTGKGAEWIIGNTGEPRRPKTDATEATPSELELDEVERFLDDAAGSGAKLVAGVAAGSKAAQKLLECGLTKDALVLLVHAKCRTPARGGKPPSVEAVQLVLEALFRLGEHLR